MGGRAPSPVLGLEKKSDEDGCLAEEQDQTVPRRRGAFQSRRQVRALGGGEQVRGYEESSSQRKGLESPASRPSVWACLDLSFREMSSWKMKSTSWELASRQTVLVWGKAPSVALTTCSKPPLQGADTGPWSVGFS